MSQASPLDTHAALLGDQLNQLASRTTRGVAELRAESAAILDDLAAWRSHLEQFRIDAELARMDTRDDLVRVHETLRSQIESIHRRLAEAREDAASAWKDLRDGMDAAFADVARAFAPDDRGHTSS
jgi:hypothetical protein